MSSNANRRHDEVSRAVKFFHYDRSGLGRESLRSKRRQAQPVRVRTRSRKRHVTLPHVSLLDKPDCVLSVLQEHARLANFSPNSRGHAHV